MVKTNHEGTVTMKTTHHETQTAGVSDDTKILIETTRRPDMSANSNEWFQRQVISAQPVAQQAGPTLSEYSGNWLAGQQATAQREEMIKSTETAVWVSVVYCLCINWLFGIAAMILAWNAQNDAHDGNLGEARKWVRRSRVTMLIGAVVSCVAIAVIIYIYTTMPDWAFKH